ncbi:metal-sensitive transcriptional regulator [Enterovirga sp. DB1703]|uniref:Metal-sensitive transcriptional regulator n=1 Tax=Enterovirga aerilata TaxID=2730920 RepID=A0A849IDQ2_9HYPH|nr:metal-sensitive transcriptional regulator [Enterovirga sp. DB1703]NNM74345.1 metal-sensitive transcriptional regulator [Enterovirga sp. DB1703]
MRALGHYEARRAAARHRTGRTGSLQRRAGPVKYEVSEGRLYLRREPEEKQPILSRLARIEGQVRGLRQMVENDRYCGEELQQATAIMAALREVSLLVLQDHLSAGIDHAATLLKEESGSDEGVKTAVTEITTLLRAVLKQ